MCLWCNTAHRQQHVRIQSRWYPAWFMLTCALHPYMPVASTHRPSRVRGVTDEGQFDDKAAAVGDKMAVSACSPKCSAVRRAGATFYKPPHAHTHTRTHTHMHARTHAHTHAHVPRGRPLLLSTGRHTHAHMQIHKYTQTHTYIHTHTHTQHTF